MSQRKRSKPQLEIIFDTNVIHTKIASELLSDDVKSFINENSKHLDFSIQWYLSSICYVKAKNSAFCKRK